jgi:hypothetical protein
MDSDSCTCGEAGEQSSSYECHAESAGWQHTGFRLSTQDYSEADAGCNTMQYTYAMIRRSKSASHQHHHLFPDLAHVLTHGCAPYKFPVSKPLQQKLCQTMSHSSIIQQRPQPPSHLSASGTFHRNKTNYPRYIARLNSLHALQIAAATLPLLRDSTRQHNTPSGSYNTKSCCNAKA